MRATFGDKRYASAIRERVQTLADVHTLLAEVGWHPVSLGDLIRQQFHSTHASAVRISGPERSVDATDAQPVALIFRELAANAVTHGSLANASGRTDVNWRQLPSGDFEIDWKETGGAAPPEFRSPGFGTVMVDALVERQLRGSITRQWLKEGLVVVIRLPAREL